MEGVCVMFQGLTSESGSLGPDVRDHSLNPWRSGGGFRDCSLN